MKINKEYGKNNLEILWKFQKINWSYCDCWPIIAHVSALGDLLAIKILKGRIKNQYCLDSYIWGFCENYLKLLHALYNCASNITMLWSPHTGIFYLPGADYKWYIASCAIVS